MFSVISQYVIITIFKALVVKYEVFLKQNKKPTLKEDQDLQI